MAPTAAMVSDLLNTLETEDYNSVVSYIRFLSESRKKDRIRKSLDALKEIQSMFAEDKGWDSEESMYAAWRDSFPGQESHKHRGRICKGAGVYGES